MLNHNIYVTNGIANLKNALNDLQTSQQESGNVLLGAIILSLQDMIELADGRNELYPWTPETGSDVAPESVNITVKRPSMFAPNDNFVMLAYRGAIWKLATLEDAHAHATNEQYFWSGLVGNAEHPFAQQAFRAWGDAVETLHEQMKAELKVRA